MQHRTEPHHTSPRSRDYRHRRRASYQGTTATARRLAARLAHYGIPQSAYEMRLELQDGKCAICAQVPGRKGLVIDHDHASGEFRELLCNRCNIVLGLLQDDAQICTAMAAYITAWKYDIGRDGM